MSALSAQDRDSLPNSAFAYIGPDGARDFPYKHADGSLDEDHVRKGIQLLDTADIPDAAKAHVRKVLVAAAKKLGIEVDGESGEDASVSGKRVTRSVAAPAAPERQELVPAGADLVRAVLPCEIRVVDQERREIELCATSEALDTYGTIFDYDASKDAFTRWIGNVREMHDATAVGHRVSVRFDDDARKVYTRVRISKGAPDTWEKVLDGTLQGASIGASNVVWEKQARRVGGQQRSVDVAKRYDLMELSLVDHPSNPDARGVTFVRFVANGEADAGLLDVVGSETGGSSASLGSSVAQSPAIVEDAGTLSAEDPAALIARAALARGFASLDGAVQRALTPSSSTVPAGRPSRAERLASLGAPGYVARASSDEGQEAVGSDSASGDMLGGMAPGEGDGGYGVGEQIDIDGDHEDADDYVTIQSGPTAGAVMAPSPAGSVAHMVHGHHHTGRYDDPSDHREVSAHQHMDGTSHVHEHEMDHQHGDHSMFPAGHNHPHGHVPEHSHSYRMADGSPIDSRLLTAEQVRTFEYVSEAAFRAARGVSGRPLSAQQCRVAMGHELRSLRDLPAVRPIQQYSSSVRALGPYSRNPDGPADAGTPAAAQQHSSTDITGESALGDGNAGMPAVNGVANLEAELHRTGRCPLCQGQIRALDRDGGPMAGGTVNGQPASDTSSSGQSDVSMPPDGWDGRAMVAEVTRMRETVGAEVSRLSGQFSQFAGRIEQRLARIEAQPMPGGPVLRSAEKVNALTSAGAVASDQYRALESLAGRIRDPQAQVAVAAEMIRMQQEDAGMAPAMQVMPRAGRGWGE